MANRGINKVILVGNVGQDPEVRYLLSGDSVANLSLATSESWKDKETGETKERTEWHRVVLFGKRAEIVQQYVTKGATLYIEGQLKTRKWQAQDGSDRYSTEVHVGINGTMQMLGPRRDSNGGQDQRQNTFHGREPPPQSRADRGSQSNGPPPLDDDIPF